MSYRSPVDRYTFLLRGTSYLLNISTNAWSSGCANLSMQRVGYCSAYTSSPLIHTFLDNVESSDTLLTPLQWRHLFHGYVPQPMLQPFLFSLSFYLNKISFNISSISFSTFRYVISVITVFECSIF